VGDSYLSHLLPLNKEDRWSDLLASFVQRDPSTAARILGLSLDDAVRVRREVTAKPRDRVDLVIDGDSGPHAVVEVKLLSGLGERQLQRYSSSFPGAEHYLVIAPRLLFVDIRTAPGWRVLAWEDVLAGFSSSLDLWVAETAAEWGRHLIDSLPTVEADTVWNVIPEGEDFELALRARMAWVFSRTNSPEGVEQDLVPSSAGASWVARMHAPARRDGYWIVVEVEENLPVQEFPRRSERGRPPLGPSVKVMLNQRDVDTSANFDWTYLGALWPAMSAARTDWVTNSARRKVPHERAGWAALVASGVPPYVGIGFGEAQTQKSRDCMFGARFQLRPDVTLGEVVDELQATLSLLLELLRVP
jgi:hypothetical protein